MDHRTRFPAALALAGLLTWHPSPARAEAASASARATDNQAFVAALADFVKVREAAPGADTDKANDDFRKLSEAEPQNPLYLAYYGATWAMKGRDAWAPWNKLRNTEKGGEILDKALAMLGPEHEQLLVRGTPVAIEVRLVAASTFLALPDLFHRLEAGKATLASALGSALFSSAPGQLRAQVFAQSAVLARKEGNAAREAEALRQAVQEWPESELAANARQRLLELGK